ncbi:MAG: cyclase/dehydrase [Pseudonocardiales bacterium]|nr:cyclase/dehydrase [Pseudonocardiales bacterium]
MRILELQLNVTGRTPADAFVILADFERYPELSEAVRSVTVTDVSNDVTVSQWEVTFRAGLLRWTEEDTFDHAARTITFRQLEGDVAIFDGSWACAESADGTRITFSARLDMGIPSLADALEPIAVRTLVDNTVSIVSGLFGGVDVVSTDVSVPTPAGNRS